MILCIDVGNTNIKYAVFDGDILKASFRVSSRHSRTADEYGATLLNLLSSKEIKTTDINGIIMPCIVSLVLSVMNTIMDKVITNNIIKVKNR